MESHRQGTKVDKRELFTLGKIENFKPNELASIGKRLLQLSGYSIEDIAKFQAMTNVGHYNYGYQLIVKCLLNMFGIERFFEKNLRSRKMRYDFLTLLQLMLCERLQEPGSKLGNYLRREDYYGKFETIALHQLYRSLDVLNQYKDELQVHLYRQQKNLFNIDLKIALYDVTTLYFESQRREENTLRKKGYSKDGKAHKLQLVLGLLTDTLGNAYGYTVYQGNTFEGNTLIAEVEKIKKKLGCGDITIVADNGMMNADNIAAIENCQYQYIIGEPIKKLSETSITHLLDKKNYSTITIATDEESMPIHYSVLKQNDKTIICTYSTIRAIKDKHEREHLIAKAKLWIEKPSKHKSRKKKGAGRYVIEKGKNTYGLDIEKIKADSRFDGYKSISTNKVKPDIADCLTQYKNLYQVEHAFRTIKSILEIRPIYVRTDEHIQGHICMCFIAYVIVTRLRTQLLQHHQKLSTLEIIRALDKMQVAEIEHHQGMPTLFMPTPLTENQKIILNHLKITPLKNIESATSLNYKLQYKK
jgi:transposase